MNISNSIYYFDLIKKCTDILIGIYHLYTSLQTFNALIDCPVKYKFLAKHTNK